MNILKKTKVYLAGNLEYGDPEDARVWRQFVTKEFNSRGITCLSPIKQNFVAENFKPESKDFRDKQHDLLEQGYYWEVHNNMKPIVRQDLAMVDKVDFLFVVINPDIPTVGSIDEIGHANRLRKPVFITIEGGAKKMPLWLAGKICPKYWHDTIESAMQHVFDINSGEEEIDEKHWRLLLENLR